MHAIVHIPTAVLPCAPNHEHQIPLVNLAVWKIPLKQTLKCSAMNGSPNFLLMVRVYYSAIEQTQSRCRIGYRSNSTRCTNG
jgi:hypothetical protein